MADIKLKDRNDNETTYTGVSKLKVPAADGGEDVVFQLPPTLQKKTVSVTENGTMEITPDKGIDALSAVALTVDVPSSGAEKFIVNVTGSVNTGTLTSDHTFSEVVAAYENGAEIECRGTFNEFAGITAICTPVAYVAQTAILLSSALDFGPMGTDGLYQFTITATASNAWTITVNRLALQPEVTSLVNRVGNLETSVETLTNNSQLLQTQVNSILAMLDATIGHQMDDKYIKFSSDTPFTIKSKNDVLWDGVVQVKADDSISNWHNWSGEEIQAGNVAGAYILYFRGMGNTHVSGLPLGGDSYRISGFIISGAGVACSGNVETLLDYLMVYSGRHPVMGNGAFLELFKGNTALITPPELPAITLANSCYDSMFSGCSSLAKLPSLPAIKMQKDCYYQMFMSCSLIKLSEVQTDTYKNAYRIPDSGTGTYDLAWGSAMFGGTGGTFTGTPRINTTYYTSNEIVGGNI
nr:MAG TPA: hypothetical protein [Caudoviricetes sp.]